MKRVLSPTLLLLTLLLLNSLQDVFANNNKADSLLNVLKTAKDDSVKIKSLLSLANHFSQIGDYGLARSYANEAVSIISPKLTSAFSKSKDEEKKLLASFAIAFNTIGISYKEQGEYSKALDFYLKSLKIREDIMDKKGIAGSYNNIGLVYQSQGNSTDALKNYFAALKMNEELGNKNWMGINYGNIGNVYLRQSDYGNALDYYLKALKIAEETGNKSGIARHLGNIAVAYDQQNDYTKALEYYFRALKMNEEIGAKDGIAANLGNIGSLYINRGKFAEARKYLIRSLTLAREMDDMETVRQNELSLSDLDSSLGNWRSAYEHLKIYVRVNSTIFNDESSKQIAEMQAKYETEKKEKEIELLNKENALSVSELKRQKSRTYFLGGILSLIAIFILFGIRAYRYKVKTNKELKIAREKAERSERLKEQFLANTSHEIRTPMNAIAGMAHLLGKTPLDKNQSHYLSAIRTSANNLLVIINDILDLSKIEAGKLEFEKIDFSLRKVLENIVQTLHFKTDEKKIGLSFTIEKGVPEMLVGDPVRINQVILNLVGNAIKFTHEGEVKINVLLKESSEQNTALQFDISDTGIGIPEDKIPMLFQSFTQASSDTTRKYGGTGLGLTISKQLTELMSGKISISSVINKGTTFSVVIPFEKSKQIESEISAVEHKKTKGQLGHLKILLAEDNFFNQEVAIDLIKGYHPDVEIEIAGNGRIALEKLKANDYDILLMDIQMPEMDGYESTKQIRQLPHPKSAIPILAQTAHANNNEINKCIDAGMNDYVSKPFDVEILFEKIGSLVKKS